MDRYPGSLGLNISSSYFAQRVVINRHKGYGFASLQQVRRMDRDQGTSTIGAQRQPLSVVYKARGCELQGQMTSHGNRECLLPWENLRVMVCYLFVGTRHLLNDTVDPPGKRLGRGRAPCLPT